MNFKSIAICLLTCTAAYAASLPLATPEASADPLRAGTSCERFNAHWQLCTRTSFNPHTNEWESEQYFVPYPNQVAEIDP